MQNDLLDAFRYGRTADGQRPPAGLGEEAAVVANVEAFLVELVDVHDQRAQTRRAGPYGDDGGPGDGEAHVSGHDQPEHGSVGRGHGQTGQCGGHPFGEGLAGGEAFLLGFGALGHALVATEEERADRVEADFLRGGAFGEQVADQTAGPYVLDPTHHRHVAFLGHAHGAPAARGGDEDQHGQQRGVQYGQDAGGGDQGNEAVQRGDAGADHATGGAGTVLGDVHEPSEVGIVDGLQLNLGCCGQVLSGGDPLHLGFQAPGAGGGPGRQGGVDNADDRGGQETRQQGVQPLGGAATAGEQGVHDGVDGEQSGGSGDALADLADPDRKQGTPVGLPRHAQCGADERGHGAQRRHHGQVQGRVLVLGPAHVVAQGATEQLVFGVGDLGIGHRDRSEEPLHRAPPAGQSVAR
ncbi:hypothetical protein ABT269_35705 [Streptomyces viridosporus]